MISVAIVGQASNPIFIQTYGGGEDVLKFEYIIHTSLDIIDDRMGNPRKEIPGVNLLDHFLGVLYPSEDYLVFGYLSSTQVKYVIVSDNLDVPETSVQDLFKQIHDAYVDAASNPFHVPGKKLTSKIFGERISALVQTFQDELASKS